MTKKAKAKKVGRAAGAAAKKSAPAKKSAAAKKSVVAKKAARGKAPSAAKGSAMGKVAAKTAKRAAKSKAAKPAKKAMGSLGAAKSSPKGATKSSPKGAAQSSPKGATKAAAKTKAAVAPPRRRRDALGHLDPAYAADLLSQSERQKDDDRAFLGGKLRSKDDLAEQLGEQFVGAATSGEDEREESFNEVVPEERGGPFVPSTAGTEFAEGTDASNPVDAKREPFPRT